MLLSVFYWPTVLLPGMLGSRMQMVLTKRTAVKQRYA